MTNYKILERLYKNYTRKHIPKILLSVFFSIIVAASTSSIAWILDPAIKKIFIDKDQTLLILIPIAVIIAFSAKGMSLYFARLILIKVSHEIQKAIKCDLLKSLVLADTKYIEKKHSGRFITNLEFDVGLIKNFSSNVILNLTKDLLTLIGLIGVMFYQNWKLSIFALIMIPLASFAAKNLGKRMGKATTKTALSAGATTSYILELFKNHKIIKIFQRENYEFGRTDNFLEDLKNKGIKFEAILTRASPIMETLTGIMVAGLIFYSGILISKGEIDVNNFFSFLAAMMLAYQPVRALATLNMGINQGLSAAKRVLPIVDLENEINEKGGSAKLELQKGNINFENVEFKYDSEETVVLKNLNLSMEGGVMTSLVGHSGAGKSTILNLIPRFYNCDSGDIKIDNQSIYKSSLSSLRSNISVVNQEITLFDDTVRNNILYANLDATDEEIYNAAKLSHSLEFIQKLPNKFETVIGENGYRLSGGEKQRLSIARAMLKKSKIILLDEATSSLDAETESKIQEAINMLTKERTTLVIAHRLSTIMNSKNIYVINSGTVAANGSHEELLETSEIYKNFYEKQLKKN